jgi:hypothetical protein
MFASFYLPQKRRQHTCRLFLNYLEGAWRAYSQRVKSVAWSLQAGKIEKGFRYSRTRFYTNIRKTLLTLGLIAIEQRLVSTHDFDLSSDRLKEKYVPVRQPIPKRPPDGLNLPRLIWTICKHWNDEFLADKHDS